MDPRTERNLERNAKIVEEAKRGVPRKELSEKYGLGAPAISTILNRGGVNAYSGSRSRSAKLVEEFKAGASRGELAGKYGITQTMVSKALLRNGVAAWKNQKPTPPIVAGDIAWVRVRDVWTIISAKDVELVEGYVFHLNLQGYVESSTLGLLHRLIMGDPPDSDLMIDHANGAKVDNRRKNMRWVVHAQNQVNSKCRSNSGYKGVYWDARRGVFSAKVGKDGKSHWIGRFRDPRDAASAVYDKICELWGEEFARTHHPDSREPDAATTAKITRRIFEGPPRKLLTDQDQQG